MAGFNDSGRGNGFGSGPNGPSGGGSRTGGNSARSSDRGGSSKDRNTLTGALSRGTPSLTGTAPGAPEPAIKPPSPVDNSGNGTNQVIDDAEARKRLLSTAKGTKAPSLLGVTASLLG